MCFPVELLITGNWFCVYHFTRRLTNGGICRRGLGLSWGLSSGSECPSYCQCLVCARLSSARTDDWPTQINRLFIVPLAPCRAVACRRQGGWCIWVVIVVVDRVSKKLCQCYFLNNSVKHRPILIIFGTQHHEKIDVNDCSFAHLTLILLLHYLVKSRSRSLAVYNLPRPFSSVQLLDYSSPVPATSLYAIIHVQRQFEW